MKAFLDAVHQHRILRLGPAEYIRVQQLLESRPRLSRRERRAALASLLATSPEQWQQIANLFDVYFPEREAPAAAPPRLAEEPASEPAPAELAQETVPATDRYPALTAVWKRLRNAPRGLLVAIVALALGVTVAVMVYPLLRPPELVVKPELRDEPKKPTTLERRWRLRTEPVVPERSGQVEIEPSSRPFDIRDGLAIVLALLLVLVGLRWLLLPATVESFRREQTDSRRRIVAAERKRLAEQAERNHAPIHLSYQVERYPPLSAEAVEDSAAILGRLFRAGAGDDLDVPATLHATIDEGGRLVPIYANRPVAQEFVVLVDIERGDHPWLAGIDWVLDRWAALGVRFARFDFRLDPLFLTKRATGSSVPLQRLARHAEGGPLLVISRTLSPQGYRGRARWLRELDAWPVKAWLDPDPRPIGERPWERREIRGLEKLGLQRFPFSQAGLLALARYFLEEGQGVQAPAWESLAALNEPEVATALPKWALLAALPAQRYLQRLIEWVAREDNNPTPESEDGRTLVLSDALVEKLIREQRERETGLPEEQQLEVLGRKLLLEQLDATRPEDELLRQFWEVKRVSHKLRLEPDRALELLAPLLGSAAEAELLRVVETELKRQAVRPLLEPSVRDRLALVAGQAANRLHPGELLGRPWRGWVDPVLAAFVIGSLAVVLGVSLETWLLRPPVTVVASGVLPAIREVELVESEFRDTLKDGSPGPVMVKIPAGEFQMGSPEDEKDRQSDERQHRVQVKAFAIGKYEVTVGEFRAFVEAAGYQTEAEQGNGCYGWTGSEWKQDKKFNWRNLGFEQKEDHPVVCVSWNDAVAYTKWLSEQTGKAYRLPTEAEWEYAVRAGTETARYWRDDADKGCQYANAADLTAKKQLGWSGVMDCEDGYVYTAPVGHYVGNSFGLHDVLGNVWEWTCSEYDEGYSGAELGCASKDRAGGRRVIRGGSWLGTPRGVRSAARFGFYPLNRFDIVGFRLAQD